MKAVAADATCPGCGDELAGLARYCPRCEAYTEDLRGGGGDSAGNGAPELPEPSEEEIRHEIVEHARALGYVVMDTEQGWRPGSGHTRVTAGLSDLILLGEGRMCFVEVKRTGQPLRESQERFREAVLRAGGDFQLWTSAADFYAWHAHSHQEENP